LSLAHDCDEMDSAVGLLDDLKAEAEEARQSDVDRRSMKARQEACYHEVLKPALLHCYRYLQELIAQLAVIDREIAAEFVIPGYGAVVARQTDRKLTIDSSENINRLSLRLSYSIDELRFSTTPLEKANAAREFFETQRMPFSDWPIRDRDNRIVGLNFLVNDMQIGGGIELLADAVNGCIQLGAYNVQGFAQESSAVAPQRIDDEWLDRLGRYILGQADHPEHKQLDDSIRAQLRARIAREKAAQAEELARLDQEAKQLDVESSPRAKVEGAMRGLLRGVKRRSTAVDPDD